MLPFILSDRERRFENGPFLANRKSYDAPRFLIGFGFTFFGLELTGATPFLLASMAADVAAMGLLQQAGASLALSTANHTTALMLASGIGRIPGETQVTEARAVAAVGFLLNEGLDVNATNDAGDTALHGAALMGSDRVVQLLAYHGAPIPHGAE